MMLRPMLLSGFVCIAAYATGYSHERQSAPTRDTKPLELHIRPSAAAAPAGIQATAIVERDDSNRALTLAAECPDYLRRSTIPLDGAAAARKHIVVFESLPACTYEIRATLHRRDGDVIEAVRTAKVTR
jgi:hypothetical protein